MVGTLSARFSTWEGHSLLYIRGFLHGREGFLHGRDTLCSVFYMGGTLSALYKGFSTWEGHSLLYIRGFLHGRDTLCSI